MKITDEAVELAARIRRLELWAWGNRVPEKLPPISAFASHEPAPTDTQEGLSVTGEVKKGCEWCSYTGFQADGETPCTCRADNALTACQQEVERLREELSAKDFGLRNGKSLAEDSLHAIRELLREQNVPEAAFIDDHVANALVQRNQAEARAVALERERDALRETLERLINPAPGVKKLPPWVYGIVRAALSQNGEEG